MILILFSALSISYLGSDWLFSVLNIVLVSGFTTVLSLIQIKKFLNSHFNKNKFELEGIGKRDSFYWVRIKNKTRESALNSRGHLEFFKSKNGAIDIIYSADAVWADPAHPRQNDIPLREELDFFIKHLKNGSIYPQAPYIFLPSLVKTLMELEEPLLQININTQIIIGENTKKLRILK